MSESIAELQPEIDRYRRLIAAISDQLMRDKLRELIAEAEAKMEAKRKSSP